LHYAHEKGAWDEWFIEMADGEILWLAEDEGELFLEKPLKLTAPVAPYDDLTPGMQITLQGKPCIIEELGQARCAGGEGQIPFVVEIGETYPYADGAAADGSFIFGLEYDTKSGIPTAFIGQALSMKESAAAPGTHEVPVARTAEAIRCTSCGKPYEGQRVETTKMVVCEACGAALKLDEAEIKVVGKNKGREPRFTFKVGTPITLENTRYEVMGRLYYIESSGRLTYQSFEYVLYNPERGYLWLSEEDGHFTISRPAHLQVVIPKLKPRARVRAGQEYFRVFDYGTVRLQWVDGALPWMAAVGEKTDYVHMIKPPDYLDREITGKEMELFRGRYVDRKELLSAVPKTTKLPLEPRKPYSCQPYTPSEWLKGLGTIGALFVALNILLLIYSFQVEKPSQVLHEVIKSEQYTQEYLGKTFEIPHDGEIVRLKGYAPLDNSWVALDFALMDAEERVLREFWDEASYYYGRDSEGSWSEGSRSFSSTFKVDKAGTYRLIVHGQGGSGDKGPPRNEAVTLYLTSGITLSGYLTFPIILSALAALSGVMGKAYFESRRWGSAADNEDDDGDDE
jgi:hypothetical protein